jgi:hypothetical protein
MLCSRNTDSFSIYTSRRHPKSQKIPVKFSIMLLVLANTAVLGFESRGTHGYILLLQDSGRSTTLSSLRKILLVELKLNWILCHSLNLSENTEMHYEIYTVHLPISTVSTVVKFMFQNFCRIFGLIWILILKHTSVRIFNVNYEYICSLKF